MHLNAAHYVPNKIKLKSFNVTITYSPNVITLQLNYKFLCWNFVTFCQMMTLERLPNFPRHFNQTVYLNKCIICFPVGHVGHIQLYLTLFKPVLFNMLKIWSHTKKSVAPIFFFSEGEKKINSFVLLLLLLLMLMLLDTLNYIGRENYQKGSQIENGKTG